MFVAITMSTCKVFHNFYYPISLVFPLSVLNLDNQSCSRISNKNTPQINTAAEYFQFFPHNPYYRVCVFLHSHVQSQYFHQAIHWNLLVSSDPIRIYMNLGFLVYHLTFTYIELYFQYYFPFTQFRETLLELFNLSWFSPPWTIWHHP